MPSSRFRRLAQGSTAVFVRYCIAGTIAVTVQLAVLTSLVEIFGLHETLSSALAFCVAVVVNYILQYYWTFSSTGSHGTLFIKFSVVACLGLVINTSVFWTLNELLEVHYFLSQVVATGLVVMFNFLINRHFVFV